MKKFLKVMLASLMVLSLVTRVQAAEIVPGVTVVKNTRDEYKDSDYTAKFVFVDTDERDAVKVEISGGFQFYKPEEVNKYETPDDARTPYYDVYHYEKGMFPSGYLLSGGLATYELTEIADESYEITLPLPGDLYYYDYTVTYADGTSVTMQDPANPSPKNPDNGHDAAHSLLYVGDRTNTIKGQEYVYPRSGKNGTLEYVTYTNITGTEQPLGIYLPYGYDESKTYKTIYVVHGGGGNEADWMTIGAVPNIMDNLIAEKEVAEAIIVTPWNANGNSVDNVVKNIIPFIEENYSVSKDPKDRAICGLSAGGSFTANSLMYANDEFGYYGVWSPSNTYLADRIANGEISEEMYKTYKDATYYIGVGIIDNQRRRTAELSLYETLKDVVGANASFEYKNGAHDWYVWRDFLTTFVKDYLWDAEFEGASKYKPGVTVETNTKDDYVADYTATFVYEDKDDRNAVSVRVEGNFFWYNWEDPAVKDYVNTGKLVGSDVRDAYTYEKGMFNSSGDVEGKAGIQYFLNETEEERFELTLPLPGNLYFYDYYVTYSDGTTVKMQDPVNPSPKNEWNGHDDGHSTFRVGTPTNTTLGQEYIYDIGAPKGEVKFVTYKAVDGTEQPLGVYLPANYDASKTYKTLYVSHGGGGNEFEWMSLGAAPTIMDNLIAAKQVDEAIVVTMDHTYFGWKYDTIAENFEKHMIPYIEANYSVSKEAEDRALCGLSMGSMTTSTMMLKYPDLFGYYGNFSGANLNAIAKEDIDVAKLKTKGIYVTAGNIDMALMASNGNLSNKTVGLARLLDELGVEYAYDLKGGAHDWGVWRAELTTFAKDVLWEADYEGASSYKPGATTEVNTTDEYKDTDYTTTFVYEDKDDRNAIAVAVHGTMQFYKADDPGVKDFLGNGAPERFYTAFEYEKGMFPTGYCVAEMSDYKYEMKETAEERFEITLPLPASEYAYKYTVIYEDGTTVTMQDPANPSPKNPNTGNDSGNSLIWVGDREHAIAGQEYIYARNDGKTGTYSFVEYTAENGTTQPLGVYLPYGYDTSKTYKTIYVSHGGGGNEAEWFEIGAVKNIMDNLIAEGEIAETIVVTMNHSAKVGDRNINMRDHIIPYIEAHYPVSKDAADRAMCGLSMGGMITTGMMLNITDTFGNYGIWSGASSIAEDYDTDALVEAMKGKTLYLTAGKIDFALSSIVNFEKKLDELGIAYSADLKNGAHDWGVWRDAFTTFAKDYLWDAPKAPQGPTETGDFTVIAPYAILAVSAAGAYVALRKKEN